MLNPTLHSRPQRLQARASLLGGRAADAGMGGEATLYSSLSAARGVAAARRCAGVDPIRFGWKGTTVPIRETRQAGGPS